ncbi:MAG TPA: hypothetical protein VFC46_08325 [Humisphaera sp.]|nr:hypothetical protein [Humisphaera sp.]
MNADAATINSMPQQPMDQRSDPPPSMRRDVTSAYVAAGGRVGAWAIVSAIVYRLAGPDHFGTLALIRGAVGILNYTSVGLAPALIRSFAQIGRRAARNVEENMTVPPAPSPAEGREIPANPPARAPAALKISSLNTDPARMTHVYSNEREAPSAERSIYSTGIAVAAVSATAGLALASIYALAFDRLHVVPAALLQQAPWAVVLIGIGTLLRLFSDVSGALLQTRGRIALDNYLLAASDASWAVMTILLFRWPGLLTASFTFAAAGISLVIARGIAVRQLDATPFPPRFALVRSAIFFARSWRSARSCCLLKSPNIFMPQPITS